MDAEVDQNACLRILDANLNRAREGLRVLEEHARFVMEDVFQAGRCKDLRHALAEALTELGSVRLALYRDTAGDVGTTLCHAGERERCDSAAVLTAAASRVSEALRALEEYSKPISGGFSRRAKQLRYESYVLAGDLIRRTQAGVRFAGVGLYVLITAELCRGDWLETAGAVLDAGAQALQLREKNLPDRELLERTRRLGELCHRHGALLLVNDRADIAAAGHADGVHLGQDDLRVRDARRLLGARAIVGVSTHSVAQAGAALGEAPDYLAVGPMFASETAPHKAVVGPGMLAQVRALTSLPLVAIGGVDAENAALLGGADTIAVCRAVIAEPDPRLAVERLLSRTVEPAT